jgi:hypothetical protein
MSTPKARVPNTVLLTAALAVAGCSTPSREDFQRMESAVAELRARVEAAEARSSSSATTAASALDSASQCNLVCLNVSERLDQLYLEILPR